MEAFEKRDIVEVAEELGIELQHHEGFDRPYYTAFCPLHDNKRTPAFAIFPHIQRFYCYTCCPEGGDVIDLVRKMNGLTFQQALKVVTLDLSPEEAAVRQFKAAESTVDTRFLQMRAATINDEPRRLNFNTAQKVFKEFDMLLNNGEWQAADNLLRKVGV